MQQKTWVAVVACVCIAVVALLLSISERSAPADEPKKDLPVPKAKLCRILTSLLAFVAAGH
jgi:negative regulator of sigma E activity